VSSDRTSTLLIVLACITCMYLLSSYLIDRGEQVLLPSTLDNVTWVARLYEDVESLTLAIDELHDDVRGQYLSRLLAQNRIVQVDAGQPVTPMSLRGPYRLIQGPGIYGWVHKSQLVPYSPPLSER